MTRRIADRIAVLTWCEAVSAAMPFGVLRRFAAVLLLLAGTGLFSACTEDNEEQYTTEYTCYFTFMTQFHPTSLLTLSLDNPGSFVKVDVKLVSGAHQLHIASNNSRDMEDLTITTDKENYLIGTVGVNGSLIIGSSTFDGRKAYDAQCPNCLNDYTGNNYPLSWTSNGQAVECAKCGRKYELNYNGRTDNGKALLQYRVSFDGSTLTVHN